MPEQTPTTDNTIPAFSLQKLYIKDISFENPNAPAVFTIPHDQPKIEMNLGVNHQQIDEDHWEVTLKISIITRNSDGEKLLFEVEVEHAAIFYLKNIDPEHMPLLLAVDAPTIIFPYTRQIISQLTIDGGFMPLLLEPINFRAAYESSQTQPDGAALH
ncbi:MAG: protein-export chaperone SecB [Mariprofundus sp.]